MKDLFLSLQGEWQLTKKILGYGEVVATASFIKVKRNTLNYSEKGLFYLDNGAKLEILRNYTYNFNKDGMEVNFNDPYLEKDLRIVLKAEYKSGRIEAEGSYSCGMDEYKVKYIFAAQNHFILSYDVLGPSKKYQSLSFFTK